jgi:hypothetical protein
VIRRWLGRWLLRRELAEAHGELDFLLRGAREFADAGQSYAIGKIDGLEVGLHLVERLSTGRYPRHRPAPTAEELER